MKRITALLFAITLLVSPILSATETVEESLETLCEMTGGTWTNGECK